MTRSGQPVARTAGPYDDSELEIYWLAPTGDAWGAGGRSAQCAVYHPISVGTLNR